MNALGLVLAFFLIRTTSSQQDECSTSSCDTLINIPIRFPFRLVGSQQPRCGYPGFDLTCDSSRTPTLRIKNSTFQVRGIDYMKQYIWLNDPNQCLPRILLTLDFWNTQIFQPVNYQEYTLFNCSGSGKPADFAADFPPIDCLSGRNYTVVAAASGSRSESARLSKASCNRIKTVAVPVMWDWQEGWISALNEDIKLTWYEPWCGECDSEGGICRLKHNSNHVVECKVPGELSRHLRYVISLALGIPASIIIFGVIIFFLKKLNSQAQNSSIEIPSVVTFQPSTMLGLDQAAIESFPKTVLSESMGLPNKEDNICPICLGEYKPRESIRTFPTCQHSFHSNCIDEWLHRNATCPVCRKYQKEQSPTQLEPSLLTEP